MRKQIGIRHVHDHATAIWENAGDLAGGRIVVCVSPMNCEESTDDTRWLDLRLDANDADGEATAILVRTPQSLDEVSDIAKFGGVVSIAVERIGDVAFNHTGRRRLRVVEGRLTLLAPAGPDGRIATARTLGPSDGLGYHPGLKAMMTCAYDAKGEAVHVHLLCLTDSGEKASASEARRRIARYETSSSRC